AVRAIELDDSLAEAHAALGLYLSVYSWNQPAAEREFRRAIELNPNYPTARQQFASYCLMAMGRFDEALAEARRAHELDPFSPVISADVARALFFARRYEEAIDQLKQNLSLDPNFYFGRRLLASIYHARGSYAEAAAEFRRALTLDDDPFSRALLARSLAKLGQTGEARKIVRELEAQSAQHYIPSTGLAVAYWALGEKDKAFMYLGKDITERASRCVLYPVYPIFDDLRSDPRFPEVVRRIETAKMD
ncbi:MAG TPA: tetratricopeptide repeat protein, partial [Pyrinomonadaceae bacterium]|nr:tetratricopeptide repeat protein [Pyrinomonadaceae bacterium]